jgi:transmembrane sensor
MAGEHTPKNAADWAAKLLENAPPLSPRERQALADWCQAEPGNAQALERYGQLWDDPAFQTAALTMHRSAAPPRRRGLLAVGAGATLALGFGAWLVRAPLNRAMADAATEPGEIRPLPPLAGGGRLLLDTASAVDLPASGQVRLMAGAMRLDLPDTATPLQIQGRWGQWQVAPGSILALRRGEADDVAVLRGQARMAGGTVEPGFGLAWGRTGAGQNRRLTLAETDRVEGFAEAWRLFAGAPLAEVAEELSRYLPGTVLVSDAVADLRVSGRFRFARPVQVLEALAQTLPVRVQRHAGLLVRMTAA